MKIFNSNTKKFDKILDNILQARKKKIQNSSVSVKNIIKTNNMQRKMSSRQR